MPTEPAAVLDERSIYPETFESDEGGRDDTSSGVGRDAASFRPAFLAGVRAISPVIPPAAVLALATGVAATAVGLSPLETVAMAVLVYSPAVILTALELLESGAPLVVVVVASLVVGVRFAMLSLSIAPYFERVGARWKWLLAYFLFTPIYVLSVERFDAKPETSRRGYYLGLALPIWVTMQAAVLAGIAFGASVPAGWGLDFVLPLVFIALLTGMLKSRAVKGAALVAGLVAVPGVLLPLGLGVVVATASGTVAGVLLCRSGGSR